MDSFLKWIMGIIFIFLIMFLIFFSYDITQNKKNQNNFVNYGDELIVDGLSTGETRIADVNETSNINEILVAYILNSTYVSNGNLKIKTDQEYVDILNGMISTEYSLSK